MNKYTFPTFCGFVMISVILFFLLTWLLGPDSDTGLVLVVAMICSLQLSFITALIVSNGRKRK
ncbi:hypothetical protein [Paenibacillus mendelii]|uniref:Uncharacterized protein n=1 Tax=Paenibacillus mendelii TaxID=206163 RepID=A0ABV6J401_9BACL|nr:hypothetical protein [Paenibacillus mendelii]MCQ6559299.1 hypothetical protein [Paenibacillus mendelii]